MNDFIDKVGTVPSNNNLGKNRLVGQHCDIMNYDRYDYKGSVNQAALSVGVGGQRLPTPVVIQDMISDISCFFVGNAM